MRIKLSGIAAAALALFLLGACAEKQQAPQRITGEAASAESTSSGTTTTPATPLTVTASELDSDKVILEVSTGGVPAGRVEVNFLNVGSHTHDVTLVKITDGDYDKFKATLTTQGLTAALAGTQTVGSPLEAAAGDNDTSTVIVDAGVYAFVATGQASDGKSLAEHGTLAKLNVEASAASETSGSSASS